MKIRKLFNKRVFILTAFFISLFSSVYLFPVFHTWYIRAAASIIWDGGGDGTSWLDPLNWDTDIVPAADDDVLIDSNVTVILSSPVTINSLILGKIDNTAASSLEFSYDAISLGALTLAAGDLTVYPGGNITHTAGSGASIVGKINIDVQSGNAYVHGTINANSKGYGKGSGPGEGTDGNGGAGGAAHGGFGGNGQTRAGGVISYGSLTQPVTLGSGGGDYNNQSGVGGGAVKLTVSGTTTINGTISANGARSSTSDYYSHGSGGGSGGSIWIQTGSLNGSGNLLAEGGGTINTYYGDGGGGAGGRIALYYSSSSVTLEQISVQGAKPDGDHTNCQKGGAGTIFLKNVSATYGDIVVDNEDIVWSTSRPRLAKTPLPSNLTVDNLTITNFADIEYTSVLNVESSLTVDQKAFFGLSNNATVNNLVVHHNAYFFNHVGANINYNSLDWTGGILVDNGGTFSMLSGGGNLIVPATSTLHANVPRSYSGVTINGTLTHTDNTNSDTYKINYNVDGDFTINSTGSIDVDSKGYSDGNGTGDGADGDKGAGGAAHGGNGGNGQTRLGSVISYGSATQPATIGSGGGHNNTFQAGHGGGAVKLIITGTFNVGGPVSANGGDSVTSDFYSHGSGGGSGGSIWINANEITGSSTISADGGGATNTYYGDGGGGGGGRIALYYDTNSVGLSQISAKGGIPQGDHSATQKGGAGTIYLKAATATNGDFVIDNKDNDWSTSRTRVAKTTLPSTLTLDNLAITNYSNIDYTSSLNVVSSLTLDQKSFLESSGGITADNLIVHNNATLFSQLGANIVYNTIDWNGGILVDNGGTFAILSSGVDLTIPSGSTLHSNVPRSYSNVFIDGVLTHTENIDSEVYKINYTIGGNLSISSSGSVNVNGKGFGIGYGTGEGTDGADGSGGAAHGGNGGNGRTRAGSIVPYGSATQPVTLGSGGGQVSGYGGAGGGAIKFIVGGYIDVGGPISANGNAGPSYSYDGSGGGGAGGSVWIDANEVKGGSTISASGGGSADGYSDKDGGGGGGGRIAIYYDSLPFAIDRIYAYGGKPSGAASTCQKGGAGTIYLKSSSISYGDLIVDNNDPNWSSLRSKVAKTVLPDSLNVSNITITDYSNIDYSSSLNVTSTIVIDQKSFFDLSGNLNVNTINLLNGSSFICQSSAAIDYTTLNWSAILVDNGCDFAVISTGGNLTIPSGATLETNIARHYDNVTVNGTLSHSENTNEEVNKLILAIDENLTVNPSGSINVNGKGYSDGYGPGTGVSGSNGAGGAAYGGEGGNGQSRAGNKVPYGEERSPDLLGSGGGHHGYAAGHGGGVIKISIGATATLNGVISANGGNGGLYDNYHGNGGGSGGSIWVTTETLIGSGSVTANGGNTANYTYDGGAGGGGRIALYYGTNTTNFSVLSVNGGVASGASAQNGGIGTIFLGGKSSDPLNLRQFKTDNTTAIGQGGNTDESSFIATFQVQDGDSEDTITPQVEIQTLGTPFSNVATNIGASVVYTGAIVTAQVTVDGLADTESYHWQARACDATNLCSDWVSYGNNTEDEADIRVVMNTPPSAPVIPESSFFINGQYTNSLQPMLSFVLSDPNAVDTVGYRIQVDTESEFGSPIIDYVSVQAAQGTQSFTVGQAAGEGTYNEGSEGQELSTDNYYWRVKAIDNKSGESDWTTATGTPSFIIDQSRPTNGANMKMKAHDEALHEYSHSDEPVWFNRNDLFFSWDDGSDAQGVKGYCVYLGNDLEGDPATQKGLLGSSPVSTTGTTCQFITADTEIDFSNSALRSYEWLTSSDDLYYFKIKTIDIANNTYVGPDETNYISFYFDNTAPENVVAISAASGTFSSTSDMFFTWPTTNGTAGNDEHSQVLGFQYAINSRDSWIGETLDPSTNLEYYSLGIAQPFYLPASAQDLIQLGQNTIFFRILDRAGNASELRTAFINYGGEAPKFAQGDFITVTPGQNDTNSFAFSWPEAEPSSGNTIDTYYYMINTPPPVSYATITSNSATYIATESTSIDTFTVPGLRKGANTIYVVAVDSNSNYSPTNTISATFYLYSELPDPPTNLTVADSSIKDVSIWRSSLVWSEPTYKGTGNLTYHIERSEDALTWEEVAQTTSFSYVDTVEESKRYYWRVGTTDNSDQSIASPSYSSAVSIIPKGSYTVPAPLTSGPASSSITTSKATISWTTSRTCDSKVAYGLASGNYFDDEAYRSVHITDHEIQLTNLSPGTKYYFKARWTDEDGNTGESDEMDFTTEPPPEVKEVRLSNVGISSALVNFTTKNATKAKIYYGTTTSFGGAKEVSTSKLETSYSVELNQLEDGTKYYYKINTFDEEDTEYEGTILDFETLPRPRVTNVRVQQVANTAQSTLLVTWESNTAISSIVTYYPENNPELVRDNVDIELRDGDHRMIIRGLFPDTGYVLRVRGQDIIGNEAVSDTVRVTTASDTRAPQISEMSVEGANSPPSNSTAQPALSQLIISWNTDEPATSQVEYGEGSGTDYNQLSQEDQNLSYNHVVIISGLTPAKVYHLRAISKDSAGNISKSIDTVTITPKATDNAFDLVITNLKEVFGFLGNL
ncbi:MAG: fibronectin type III domain-containing protein [Patescibacteria group bacterium]|jgi:hypothetical protein